MAITSIEGRLTKVNEAFAQMLGYRIEQLLNTNFLTFTHPDDRALSQEIKRILLAKEQTTCRLEKRYRHRDGHPVWTEVSTYLLRDAQGKPLHFITSVLDISERKKQQEELRKTESLMQSALANLPLIFYVIDLSGVFQLSIGAGLKGLGLSPNQVVGQSAFAVYQGFSNITDAIERALKGETVTFEANIGSSSYFNTCVPFANASGVFAGTVGVALDISERKQVEQALRESEAGYRALVRGLPDIVMSFDREGRHLFASENVRLVTDLEAKTFIGKTHRELGFPADQCKVWEDAIATVFRDGTPVESEFEFDSHGRSIVFNWRLLPQSDEDGAVRTVLSISRDVTRQRRAEADYQRLFREMLDGVAVHEIICDENNQPIDYRFLSVNPAFERLTGLRASSLVGRTVLEVMPDTERHWIDVYGTVALTGEPAFFESESAALGKHFQVTAFCPAPGQFVCIFADITDRIRTEEFLRASEAKFSEVFRASPAALFITDLNDGTFIEVNDSFTQILEYDREEVIGRTTGDLGFWAPPDRLKLTDSLRVDKVQREIELALMTKSGTPKTLVGSIVLVNVQGRPCMLSTFQDITESRRTASALRESQEMLQSVVDNASLLVYAKDLEGRLTLVNREFATLFGKSREELLGKTSHDLMGNANADAHRANDLAAITKRAAVTVEERNEQPDGTHVYLTTKFPLFNLANEIAGVCGISADITERKRAEEEKVRLEGQLQQAQKLESVGRLAGGVAHDFNNMLGVILGSTELAAAQINSNDAIYSDLMEIRKAAERSADLTRQLLAFARQQPVLRKTIDLNETIGSMLKMLRRLIGEGITLTWQPAPEVWNVRMDPSQFNQILANLCVNARDAIRDVGWVRIATRNAVVEANDGAHQGSDVSGDYVLITVSDSGCGIPEATLAHIFEPFFTTKAVGEGTGLGLSMVYGAVSQNGGFVEVSSKADKGTTFSIYLPRYLGEATKEHTTDITDLSLHARKNVLLLEDEPVMLRVVRRMLETYGYTVFATGTPTEAIRAANAYGASLDLLITDVIMPEMNGRELSERVLALCPRIKVIFMSGYTANVLAPHGVLEKGEHFIEKPFKGKDLVARVRDVLREPPKK